MATNVPSGEHTLDCAQHHGAVRICAREGFPAASDFGDSGMPTSPLWQNDYKRQDRDDKYR